MKQIKRLLSGLLTLLLVLSCFAGLSLPASAEDVTTSSPYGLYIGGNPVTAENKDNFKRDSKVSIRFDPETTTLYLNGASVTSAGTIYVPDYYNSGTKPISGAILYTAGGTLTIELTDTNSFGSTKSPGDYGIYINGSLTVNGAEKSRLIAFGTVGLYINGNRTYTQNGGIVTATGVGDNGFVNNHYGDAVVMNGGELDAIVTGTPEDTTKGIALNVPNGKIRINNDAKVYGSTSLQGARGIYGGNGIYPSGRHWVLSGKKNAVQLQAEAALIGTGPVPIYYCQFDKDKTVASTVYITPRDLHEITVTAEHGTITLDTDQGYFLQQVKILVWTPDPGYRLRAIHIKDVEAGETFDIDLNVTTYNPDYSPNVYYAFTMPDGRCEVTGDFVAENYPIHFDPCGAGGSMADAVTDTTDDELNATYTLPTACSFTPEEGMSWTGKWYVGDSDEQVDGGTQVTVSGAITLYPVWQETHDGQTFYSWPRTDRLPNATQAYYLAYDVALAEPWVLKDMLFCYLCLNGHTVTQTAANSPVIQLGVTGEKYETGKYGMLSLCDHTNLGAVTGGTDSGVKIVNGALLLMGGSITGNSSPGNGGGVSIVNLDEGFLNSSVIMNGGSITGNTAAGNGGGVYAEEGFSSQGGGSITGNTAAGNGGGVYAGNGVSINVGTDGNSSGALIVTNNTANGAVSNLYLPAGKTVSYDNNGQLPEGSSVGISTETVPTKDAPVTFTANMPAGNEQYFFSDNESYSVGLDSSSQAMLFSADVIRFEPGLGSGSMPVGLAAQDGSYTLPANGFTAPAGEIFAGWQIGSDPALKNPGDVITVSGGTTVTALWTDTHNGVTFQPWLYSDRLPDTAGNWYLMSDVTLTAQWIAPTGATRLCLNGKTVTQSGVTVSGIQVPSSAALQVYDHTGAGTITGFDASGNGGAIYNEGTFALFGGAITGNRSNGDGGAIYSSGSVAIHGGSITNNTARLSGGAISAHAGEIAVLGGEISGNTATTAHGGAIYFANSAKLDLRGGTITDNTAGNQGGGILANNTTQRSFTVRGSVVVTGNTGGNGDNIYLRPNNYITVADNLGQSANLGITTETRPALGSPVTITSGLSGKGSISAFFSDDDSYRVFASDAGEAVLARPYLLHFAAGDGTGQMGDVRTASATFPLPQSEFQAPNDKQFRCWQDEDGGEYAAGASYTFSASKQEYTFTAIWEGADHGITVQTTGNGTVNVHATAKTGETVQLVLQPDPGWRAASVTVQNAATGDEIEVTDGSFIMPMADVTVSASFAIGDYTVTVSPTENGTVSADPTVARMGDEITLTVNPAEGYELKTLTVSGEGGEVEVTNGSFTMPGSDVTVSATFGLIDYSVTVNDSTNGTVSADKATANAGETVALSVTPDDGYALVSLTVSDGNNEIAVENNRFTMPGANVTVTAVFGRLYGITLPSSVENGTITSDRQQVAAGQTVTLTVTPEAGYDVAQLLYRWTGGDGSDFTVDASAHTYAFTMPEGDVEIVCSFGVPVPYVDAAGNDMTPVTDYTVLTADMTELSNGWYVAQGSLTISERMAVSGSVNLILCDGAVLTVPKGITVDSGNALVIWQQRGEATGQLIAQGSVPTNYAGIGGSPAQIASAQYNYDSGSITINGGVITAKGGYRAAGIGGGYYRHGGTITINGGTVNATGNLYGAGIGGGDARTGGVITINGGTVNATGGKDYDGGIYYSGAGIGGGRNASGGTITINGGTVNATGGTNSAGIGGGFNSGGGTITINGGSVQGNGGIGASSWPYNTPSNLGTVTLSWSDETKDAMQVYASKYYSPVTLQSPFCNSENTAETFEGAIDDNTAIDGLTLIPPQPAAFIGHSLSLVGDIGVNFYVNPNSSTDNLRVVFAWGTGNEKTVQLSQLTAIADGDYAGCYKFTANVAAKEMTDTITATIYSGETVLATDRYSVKAYCTAILGDSSYGEALQALVRNMLIYGAKAQLQFNYNTDSLADADLGSASQAAIDTSTLGSYGEADLSDFDLEFASASLGLETKLTHHLYFTSTKTAAELNEVVQVKCGKAVLTFADGTGANAGKVYVDIPDISAKNTLKNYTVRFSTDNFASSTPLRVNAGAYIGIVLSANPKDIGLTEEAHNTLKSTVTALYWYSTAAETYFES